MKQRILSILLSLAMMFTLVPTALAEDTEAGTASVPELENPATSGTSGGIDWKVEGGTLTITPSNSPKDGCTKGQMVANYGTLTKKAPADADYIAALEAAGYTPGSNGHFYYPGTDTWVSDSPWKFLSEQITKVVVEDGVTSIAARAFRLPNVTEVSIPASVESIGNLVFEACKKLTTVHWTGDWTDHASMPFNGFSRCSSLGEGYELTEWMPACFYVYADSDSSDSSDSIEGTQFTVDFDKLNGRLQDGTTYPRAMFRSVPKITSATLTSQLNVDYIFEYSGIQSVTIADDQTSIATAAFRGCEGLTSVTIPASVTVIHMRAFADSGLKNITFSGSTSPTFGSVAFENVKLDSVTLNENMSLTEAVKIIGELTREEAITDSTTITPAKFANFNAENVVVDGKEGEAINHQSYPSVKNLTINGAYTSAVMAFGNSSWGQETLKNLTIQAPGEDVTIKDTAFLRTPLESVQIEAKKLTFTGDAAFLNTMYLTRVDLTGVDKITLGAGGKRTFAINDTNNGNKSAPTRYVYFKDADARSAMSSQFGGNTATYYLVTNGGTVVGEQDGFSAVVKGGYTAEWHEKANFSDSAVKTPEAGKVYYAKWTKSASVALTSNPAADADGKVSATYTPSGAVTLSVQNPGAGWLYVWMKDNKRINGTESSLTLYTPSESGEYSVQIMIQGSNPLTWTSNAVNVTITKADVTNTAKEDVHHTFGTTYDVSNLFSIDPNAGDATYTLVENAGIATLEGNILTITKAGTIKVSLTTAKTDNYNAGSAVTAALTVDKAKPTIAISADQTSLTGAGTVKLTVTSNGVPEKGTVTVTCDNGITVTKNTDGTFTAVLPNETKTYTFTASYNGDANHEKASGTCQVSVTRRSSSSGSSSSGSSYAVSTPSTKNGDVTVSPKNASKGDRVTVTVKPDSGYEIGSVTVLDSKGNELKLTDKGNGKYTFTMPGGKVEVKATFVKAGETSPFVDVPADSYYFDAVKWAQKLGITNGKTDALFGANDPCTRGQIVTFLWRAAGSPAPKGTAKVPADVLPGSYCYDAVAWAIENGVTNGFADGTFGVNSTCTRGQSVTFLYRALGTAPTTVNGFTDVAAGDFYAEAVAWAVENGVTNGTTDSTFSPSNGCTRAQIVTFLYRTKN
mgnify:CR=1 FL=1